MRNRSFLVVAPFLVAAASAACAMPVDESEDLSRRDDALTPQEEHGQLLFNTETFGGNGRTCSSCHPGGSGTVNPAEAQARFAADPNDSLFRSLDSDDGEGSSFTRLLTHATIRIHIPLPPCVTLEDDPSATEVVLNRGIPTTLNTPALDPVLMYDGREPTLQAQALGAVHAHTENTREPTATELDDIAAFQKTSGFFSSPTLEGFAAGGPAPVLPTGTTAEEVRGRAVFDRACFLCHGESMLNATRHDVRFFNARVSEDNNLGNPMHRFLFPPKPVKMNKDGTFTCTAKKPPILVVSPDPGRALITGNVADVNVFKTNPLWGIPLTAPYFHDNHADTLEDVAAHYAKNLPIISQTLGIKPPITLSAQDESDLVAFLHLL